jgi:site-specific recombinase XerD
MTNQIVFYTDSAEGWERSLMAFLAEKQRRSGSRRTPESYSRMLQHFFGRLRKPPDQVKSQEVFAWAHGKGLSGKEPAAVTIGARMACLSSFYKFLIRMEIVTSNPCDALERPRISHSPPRGLSADEIRRLLAAIPETKVGLRDRAIVLTLTLTGRRRTEVLSLTRNDISQEGETAYYSYRGKGGKQAKREQQRATGWRPCTYWPSRRECA